MSWHALAAQQHSLSVLSPALSPWTLQGGKVQGSAASCREKGKFRGSLHRGFIATAERWRAQRGRLYLLPSGSLCRACKSQKPADSRAGRVALPVLPALHSCADPLLGKMLLMLFDRQAQTVGWQLSVSASGRDQPLLTARDRKSFVKLTANML